MAVVPQNLGVPTGTVMWHAAPTPPVGWLVCDGRTLFADSYPALFDYLKDEFGGDGVSTFQLPDLLGRFIIGFGDPGRPVFAYEDGVNQLHKHGMFATQQHTHGVTDPGHEHPTSSGTHTHVTTSDHTHIIDSDHKHLFDVYSTAIFAVITNCNEEVYGSMSRYPADRCQRNPEKDFWITDPAKTGLTATDANITGCEVEKAFTGVTLATQVTGITLKPSESNMTVDNYGDPGGPYPQNLALLPIIRT